MSTFSEEGGDGDGGRAPTRRRGRPPGGGLPPEQARELLLDAAQHCFLELGLTASTMEVVARRAGFSRAVVYRHFRNRDELMLGLTLRNANRYLVEAAERFIGLPDPADIITESLVFLATEVRPDPVLTLLSARSEHGTVADLVTAAPELTELMTGAYQAALSRFGPELLRPGLPVTDAARYLFSIVLALFMGAIPGTDDPDQVRRYVTTFVLPAVLADPPPPRPLKPPSGGGASTR